MWKLLLKISEISSRVGRDRKLVSRMIKIAKWNSEIHKIIESKKLSYKKLEPLVRKSLTDQEILNTLLGKQDTPKFTATDIKKKNRIDLTIEEMSLDKEQAELCLKISESLGFLTADTYKNIDKHIGKME